ncbi:MAG: sigma-70 family RNA polymerase sigma factor [Verrucomicrobiota bacterium]
MQDFVVDRLTPVGMTDKTPAPETDSLLPTRQSLLSRLRDCQDQAGWREFFDTYWRLIYNVARQAGLNDSEGQEIVQNTFIYLTRRMSNFQYDRARGSFKSWLRVVTRSRIHVFWRRQKRDGTVGHGASFEGTGEDIEAVPDPSADVLDDVWQKEWEDNLVSTALRRVRATVSSRQLLIFRLSMSGEFSLPQVAKKLGISLAQVYLARHRVGRLMKAELLRLKRETE